MTPERNGVEDREPAQAEPARTEPEGGDPACWADQVCPACGRLTERTTEGQCAACKEAEDAS